MRQRKRFILMLHLIRRVMVRDVSLYRIFYGKFGIFSFMERLDQRFGDARADIHPANFSARCFSGTFLFQASNLLNGAVTLSFGGLNFSFWPGNVLVLSSGVRYTENLFISSRKVIILQGNLSFLPAHRKNRTPGKASGFLFNPGRRRVGSTRALMPARRGGNQCFPFSPLGVGARRVPSRRGPG